MIEKKHHLVHHFIEESAVVYPNTIALVHEDMRASYKMINDAANQLAHWLIGIGVAKGERLAMIMENSLAYVVGYYGALKAGLAVAPLSYDLKPEQLLNSLMELEPVVVLASSRGERLIRATDLISLKLKKLVIVEPKLNWTASDLPVAFWRDILTPSSSDCTLNPACRVESSDLASIIYTSGSTGTPKGVMLSHGNIVANTHSICEYLQLTEKDIQMIVLPFFYVMGKSLMNTHFAVGGKIVINNKFAFPASVIQQMIDENVTGFSGVPSTYAYLLHRSPLSASKSKLASLRYCTQAGGHMSRGIKQGLKKALPDHTSIFVMYGATEASARLAFLDPEQYENKMGSIGKAIPGVTLKIIGRDGLEVAIGDIGELAAKGDNIMQGYWRDPESTAKVIDENGYHTGDLGYQDQDGYFFLTGRTDRLLKVGGHRVNPQEIEDAIMETGFVIEVIVVGVKDDLLGNKLVALAVPIDEKTDEDLIMVACAGSLPKYKMPSKIQIIKSLPKNAHGKIDQEKILAILQK